MCDVNLNQFYLDLYQEAMKIAMSRGTFSAKTLASESILISDIETGEAIIKRMLEDGKITPSDQPNQFNFLRTEVGA